MNLTENKIRKIIRSVLIEDIKLKLKNNLLKEANENSDYIIPDDHSLSVKIEKHFKGVDLGTGNPVFRIAKDKKITDKKKKVEAILKNVKEEKFKIDFDKRKGKDDSALKAYVESYVDWVTSEGLEGKATPKKAAEVALSRMIQKSKKPKSPVKGKKEKASKRDSDAAALAHAFVGHVKKYKSEPPEGGDESRQQAHKFKGLMDAIRSQDPDKFNIMMKEEAVRVAYELMGGNVKKAKPGDKKTDEKESKADRIDSKELDGIKSKASNNKKENVKIIQEKLVELEYEDYENKKIKVDNLWGKRTRSALSKMLYDNLNTLNTIFGKDISEDLRKKLVIAKYGNTRNTWIQIVKELTGEKNGFKAAAVILLTLSEKGGSGIIKGSDTNAKHKSDPPKTAFNRKSSAKKSFDKKTNDPDPKDKTEPPDNTVVSKLEDGPNKFTYKDGTRYTVIAKNGKVTDVRKDNKKGKNEGWTVWNNGSEGPQGFFDRVINKGVDSQPRWFLSGYEKDQAAKIKKKREDADAEKAKEGQEKKDKEEKRKKTQRLSGSFNLESKDRLGLTVKGEKISFKTGKYYLKTKKVKVGGEEKDSKYFFGAAPAGKKYFDGDRAKGKARYWEHKNTTKPYFDYLMKLYNEKNK